jgi:hypothetical protein
LSKPKLTKSCRADKEEEDRGGRGDRGRERGERDRERGEGARGIERGE